ncbi:hypothetical protein [Helicobacter bizzozeronii]|uniref:hypothetical protein n=1 Tax=Helicobacter bizzozeronii TaxID=56877 RepID=UPI000CF1293F|nr:hypothetical protein [Helicobacter bizzozeronii]
MKKEYATKTICHEKRSTEGENPWLYPDMVGVHSQRLHARFGTGVILLKVQAIKTRTILFNAQRGLNGD